MCHDTDAAPPGLGEPPTRAIGGPLTLNSADGTIFSAFLARPERPLGRTGVLILPDVRGLHPFYERLAERLAEQGHTGLAIDYFGCTAGLGPRGDDFPVMEHILKVRREKIDDDIDAAVDRLRSPDGGGCTSVLALGFCFGGRQAFFAARPRFGLAGVIGFYGGPGVYPNGALGPTQRATELTSPILALFGGADEGIPASEVGAFEAALGAAGVEHEIVTYPDAPHGFFDVKQAEHADASADAWRRVLGFLDRHAAG